MRKLMCMGAALICSFALTAQKANVNWGEEFKMRKGSTDLAVIHADKDGVFLREGHLALKSYFVIAATLRESATLVKLDKSLEEVFRNDFNKELKGKEFEDFFFLQNKMFLLATSYSKSDKRLTLHAAELSKADGKMTGEWMELDGWEKESNKDDISFKADYNGDSTKMIIVSTVEGKEKNTYNLREFDARLRPVGKAVTIANEFEPKTFQLEDVVYATNGNIVMVGREFEYQEGKKKKNKYRDFKNYLIRIYKPNGSLLKEINTDIQGKWLISSKMSQIKGKELILAAFYSNTKRGKETNGMLVQRIDPANGDVIGTSNKELNTSLITVVDVEDDDDDESKKERKEREKFEKMRDEEDGFSRNLRFRNFIPSNDGGLIMIAEEYSSYSYAVYQTSGSGANGLSSGRWVNYTAFISGNIMMSKVDGAGNLTWLHVLPKMQQERIQTGSTSTGGGVSLSLGINYFSGLSGYPFYSGFSSMPVADKSKVAIVFNDGSKNANVLQLGQKVKMATRFNKSDCYYVALDMDKGTYTRTTIFSNDDIPVAMPRLGSSLSNVLYLVGKQDRMLGKTKISVGKITF